MWAFWNADLAESYTMLKLLQLVWDQNRSSWGPYVDYSSFEVEFNEEGKLQTDPEVRKSDEEVARIIETRGITKFTQYRLTEESRSFMRFREMKDTQANNFGVVLNTSGEIVKMGQLDSIDSIKNTIDKEVYTIKIGNALNKVILM